MPHVRLIDDPDRKQYHIQLSQREIEGARAAIVPGAPERAELLAGRLAQSRRLASHRGLDSWIGRLGAHPVLVTNTGMGGPSTEIVVQELAQLGIEIFLRIGTTGTIRADIPVGSLIVTEAAVRLDGTSDHYAPPPYPAVADLELTLALKRAAAAGRRPSFCGITVSSASFFPGQERYDSASGHVQRGFVGSLDGWRELGAINYEMEAGTLLTMTRTMGLRAGCLCAVVANRTQSEAVVQSAIRAAEEDAADVGLKALKEILG